MAHKQAIKKETIVAESAMSEGVCVFCVCLLSIDFYWPAKIDCKQAYRGQYTIDLWAAVISLSVNGAKYIGVFFVSETRPESL